MYNVILSLISQTDPRPTPADPTDNSISLMNTQEKMIARIMFKSKIYAADGQSFENLFTSIMGYARADFRGIKPQGKFGDRKNDGCEPASGRYYQVYAPENVLEKESAAINKLEADFAGLKTYWGTLYGAGIKEYFFVLNDKYKGAFPTTHKALSDLQSQHNLTKADVFSCKNLEAVLFSELDDDQVQVIVGFIPDPSTIVKIDYDILNEVVSHVLENTADKAVPGKLISPEFESKLTFNDLNAAAPYLKSGSYLSNAVESFFDRNTDFARQSVRQSLNDMYINAKQHGFVSDPVAGLTAQDQMYFDILANATPNTQAGQKGSVQRAAQVLLSYFFESCDIFEEPA